MINSCNDTKGIIMAIRYNKLWKKLIDENMMKVDLRDQAGITTNEQKAKQIQLTDFQVGSGGICKMLYFNNGIKVKEYIMEINKMTYSHLNLDIVLELNDIDSVDKEYVAYSETVRGFGNMYPKIYFSSDEKIIITKVK